MAEIKFKRGDTVQHSLTMPLSMYEAGATLHFTAKPKPDDDLADTKAVIDKQFGSDVVTIDEKAQKATYTMLFSADDTKKVEANGQKAVRLDGEIEYRYTDGRVVSVPNDGSLIPVVVYADIRRGGKNG